MKLNAIVIVKNEADILIETLKNALRFCDTLYLFDNGSTDGTWEQICDLAAQEPRVVIAERSFETYRNQLRNRIYNRLHQQYSADDWWYILDADEIVLDDPRPMLEAANKGDCNWMRVWQAQFYFTDKDMAAYAKEDHQQLVSERRRYYRINWREARFFRNRPDTAWPETQSGRIPQYCDKVYGPSPICCHYAERTPEQIKRRIACRKSNPFSFLHVKNRGENDWIKRAEDCHYHVPGQPLTFSLWDKFDYFRREAVFWCAHRGKNLQNLLTRCCAKPAITSR